jgi:hypothetical protein
MGGWKRFPKAGAKDITAFALAFLLASGIWLIHGLSQKYVKLVNVPVEAVSNLPGHAAVSSNSSVVSARCRTTGFDLIRLRKASEKKPVSLNIRVEDLHPVKDEAFYITSTELNRYVADIFGDAAEVESFISDTLVFRFPQENHKTVPVYPVYTISFKPQYTAVSPMKVTPDSVIIYGEPFHLDQIDRVYTRSFSLENLRSSAHGEAKLSKVNGVRMSEENVEYSIDVSRYVELKTEIEVNGRHVPAGKSLIIYPPVATVTFMCYFPVTSNPVDEVRLYVDYEDFLHSMDGKCIPHTSKLPQSVFDCKIEPQIFECVESVK